MIEWNSPKRGGRAGSAAYMAISVIGVGTSGKHASGQLVIRFGPVAVKDLRLMAGDRVLLGLDSSTKQVCFKRTTDSSGYKLVGKPGGSLTVAATMDLPVMAVQTIEFKDVKVEGTHVAVNCPLVFQSSVVLMRGAA